MEKARIQASGLYFIFNLWLSTDFGTGSRDGYLSEAEALVASFACGLSLAMSSSDTKCTSSTTGWTPFPLLPRTKLPPQLETNFLLHVPHSLPTSPSPRSGPLHPSLCPQQHSSTSSQTLSHLPSPRTFLWAAWVRCTLSFHHQAHPDADLFALSSSTALLLSAELGSWNERGDGLGGSCFGEKCSWKKALHGFKLEAWRMEYQLGPAHTGSGGAWRRAWYSPSTSSHENAWLIVLHQSFVFRGLDGKTPTFTY